jgi:hypothetical protein
LLKPAVVQWGYNLAQRPVDVDREGTPIRNSAGDYFDPLPVRTFYTETLTITKYFEFYDRDMARRFRNTVNSNSVDLSQVTPFPTSDQMWIRIASTVATGANNKNINIRLQDSADNSTFANVANVANVHFKL